MKIIKTLSSLVLLSVFYFLTTLNTSYAGECFPKGSITVSFSGSTGQTAHAEVSPMGDITIDYPNGALRGHIDSLGHFTASNDYTTVNGNVDTACTNTQSSFIDSQRCLLPVTKDCDANALGAIAVQQNMSGIGNTMMGTGAIQACKDRHAQYQIEVNTYNACLNSKSQPQAQPSQVSNSASASVVSNKITASCQEQHGVHSVEENGNCTCPTVGYSFDQNKQCVPDVPENGDTAKKLIKVSTEPSDITRVAGEIFQSYYPDSVDILNKAISDYSSGNKDVATKSFLAIKKSFEKARSDILYVNDTYKDKNIDNKSTDLLYSLKTSATVCDLTTTIMISGDTQGVGVTTAIKKCNDWSARVNGLIGTSTLISIKNNLVGQKVTKSDSVKIASVSFNRTLKKGVTGDDVKQLQILLQKLNYLPSTQVPSTYFGGITSNALIKFQKDNKIQPATGSFGPTTQARILSLTR